MCIENTHNRCGGQVLSLDYMRQLKAWADSKVTVNCVTVSLDCSYLFGGETCTAQKLQEGRQGQHAELLCQRGTRWVGSSWSVALPWCVRLWACRLCSRGSMGHRHIGLDFSP